jgi:hypothetical protein
LHQAADHSSHCSALDEKDGLSKGMYSDGHEREDVVNYRQNVFLPQWRELETQTRWWNRNHMNTQIEFEAQMQAFFSSSRDAHIVVLWWHNESTFYAND